MTVSAMDTAKLLRSRTEIPAPASEGDRSGAAEPAASVVRVAPVEPLTLAEVAEPVPPVVDRRSLREERRQVRRQQRRYAVAGVAFLAAVFLAAVVVLGGIR